ncbi:MAG: hypothetical protein GEU91_07195 [Rhizobiales bacterium]|nr:hypothetical protein [Hyphomicrobiales bacterium]
MSVLAVNRLLRGLLHDRDFRAAMKADPAKAMTGLDLTDAERKAILDGDVVTLYKMGVNSFLMGYLPRFEISGMSVPLYNERIRTAEWQPGAH